MSKYFLGIDPGKNGAVAVLKDSGSFLECFSIPLIGNVVDILELNYRLQPYKKLDTFITMEEIHAIFGCSAGSTFSFGMVYGLLQGLIVANGFKHALVQPKRWQAIMFEGIPKIEKSSKSGKRMVVDTKKMAHLAKQRLFPELSTGFEKKTGTPIDGKIDALLIAEYGRRQIVRSNNCSLK